MQINGKSIWASQEFHRASKQATHSSMGLRRQKSQIYLTIFME